MASSVRVLNSERAPNSLFSVLFLFFKDLLLFLTVKKQKYK